MTLYEINKSIVEVLEKSIDPETGEFISDAYLEDYEQLQMERSEKIENIGLYIKNLEADAKAIKEEASNLTDRARSMENKAKHLRYYMQSCLGEQKFQTTRLSVSFRHTKKVEVDDDYLDVIPEEFLRFKDPEPDKKAIGDALKSGEYVPGCSLVDNVSMIIK